VLAEQSTSQTYRTTDAATLPRQGSILPLPESARFASVAAGKSVLELSVPQSSPAVSTVGADLIAKPLSTSLDHGPLQGVLGIISDGRCKVGRDPVLVKQPGRILDEPLLRCAERKYGL
jgi:hypothetical protein